MYIYNFQSVLLLFLLQFLTASNERVLFYFFCEDYNNKLLKRLLFIYFMMKIKHN